MRCAYLLLAFLGPIASQASEPCLAVDGERILGRHLKAVQPAYRSVPDETVVALSPAPGVRRVLAFRDLNQFGDFHGDLCFVRPTGQLDPARIEAALRASLGSRRVDIEIVDHSRAGVPEGDLEFLPAGLQRPAALRPETPVFWRGRVISTGGRTVPVWVSVRLAEQASWLESAVVLTAGTTIEASQLKLRTGLRFPVFDQTLSEPSAIIGLRPRRSIPAGTRLTPSMFESVPAVVKGDTVTVGVNSGAIQIRFEARAETEGRAGDFILVSQSKGGRRFKARVSGKGMVTIDVKSMAGTVAAGVADAGKSGGE